MGARSKEGSYMYTKPNQESHFLITRQFRCNGLALPLLVFFFRRSPAANNTSVSSVDKECFCGGP
jgi:hypothetical protein